MVENASLREHYQLDAQGFLVNYEDWDQEFPIRLAPRVGIRGRLTEAHWGVLMFIRTHFLKTGECPLVYQVCRARELRLADMKRLFPAGYLRGACRLAGITYRDRIVNYYGEEASLAHPRPTGPADAEKTYGVDARGFLVDPRQWDPEFAIHKARELGMEGDLTGEQWKVLEFLRRRHDESGAIPTVYESCEMLDLEIEDLERLFPRGYHRGAVKLAGLRARPS